SLRLAALALLADGPAAERALAELELELPTASASERPGIEHAIFEAASRADETERACDVLGAMAERHPRSDSVPGRRVLLLARLGRWREIDELLARRAEDARDEPLVARLRAHALAEQGELATAAELLEQLERRGHATPDDLNTLAWLGLFLPDRLATAAERAERAARETNFGSYPVLNTLAAVYASLGRTAEGLQVWKTSLEVVGGGEPRAPDLYVLGLLAENYGLADAARGLHRRAIEPDRTHSPISTSHLAAERLRRL